MQTSPLLTQFMEALRCLLGVGPKSVQRMAFTLLQRNRNNGMCLAQTLTRVMSEIGHCADCCTFAEQETCSICSNPRYQENDQVYVVESPAGIYVIEQTGQSSGRYFVLMGHLSPLDGIGPDDIRPDRLEQHPTEEKIVGVILATNSTVEDEATVNYIAELCTQYNVEASRIAHGVPIDGELEMVDGITLSRSLNGHHRIYFQTGESGITCSRLKLFSPIPTSPSSCFQPQNGIIEVDLHERTGNPWSLVRGETASAPDDPFSLSQ